MCLISSRKLNISITCIFVVLQSGRWLIEVDSDPGRARPFSPFSHSDWGTRGRYKWPARLACKWGLQLLVINNIGQTTQLEYPPHCISSLVLQVELKMGFRVFFLLQIATTSFARKCKGKVLHKRNIGVLENKQKRFTEHPPRKKQRFWKYLTALCGFTLWRIYVTQQKGALRLQWILISCKRSFHTKGNSAH